MHVSIMVRVTQEQKFGDLEERFFYLFETHLLFVLCSRWALIGYGGNKRETEDEKVGKVVSPSSKEICNLV